MESPIVIIGSSHHNTLSMVRSFGHAGYTVDVFLLNCKRSYISKSKFIHSVYYVDVAGLVGKLQRTYSKEVKPILISCSDEVSQALDRKFDELNDYFFFFNCGKKDKLSFYLDKSNQIKVANKVGMLTPWSELYEKGKSYEYPCIIKPLESIRGGKHIEICHNKIELESAIARFSVDDPILVQKYIEKNEEIVLVGISLNKKVIIPGFVHKYRETAGGTTYSKICNIKGINESLVTQCKELVLAMNYTGLFGIEFLKTKNDEYYFIEINLRNDATTYSIAVGGVNLPVEYAKAVMNSIGLEETVDIKEITSIVDFKDLPCALHQHVGITEWWHQYKSAECKYYFDKMDMKPFVSYFVSFILSRLCRLIFFRRK